MFSPREKILMWLFVTSLMLFCESSESGECNDKLAMPSKRTQDINITSSSELSSDHAPAFARLDGPRAWCSAPGDKTPYIQITWDEEKLITAMETQGSSHDFSWARRYEVRYLTEEGEWTSYKKSLIGNRNSRSLKRNYFKPAIRTQSVQIYPKKPFGVMIYSSAPVVSCLRLELYGCSAPEPCHPLQMPSNGKIHNNDTKLGALVSFSCNTGFKLHGSRQITCVDGRWNGSIPTCKGYCKDPGPLRNGSVLGDDYSSGSSIQFRCNVGYRLRGSQIIYCVNGTWNETIPECKIIKCGDPGKPSNGKQIVKKGFVYGGRIKFECDRDYTLDGTHTTYCQADKSWTSPVPRCLAPCEGPADPIHGLKRGRDFRHGRSVSFDCYSGYQRIGAASITCNDGKWDNRVPLCKGVCGRPRTSLRVRLHGNSYLNGDKVTFSCNGNHDLFGKAELSCVGRAWDSTVPECKARCTLIGKPNNGFYVNVTREGDIIKHGEWINYDCIGGYTLVGNGTQECSDGRWTNPIPYCKANCLDPGAPYQGKTVDQDFRHGRTVRFTCPSNYTIEGVAATKCTDGQWNNNKPSCKAPCPDPGVPYQGKTIDQDFRHSRTVRFTCPINYVMEGVAAIKCTDGQWNNNKPSCKANCLDPGVPYQGKTIDQDFRHSRTVRFTCPINYVMEGVAAINCTDGQWSNNKPSCKANCLNPGVPYQGKTIDQDFRHGRTVRFTCPRNYVIEGVTAIKCRDGQWNTKKPSCKAPCPDPGVPYQGNTIDQDFRHGRTVRFTCPINYVMEGVAAITCTDGQWNNNNPSCKAPCKRPADPTHGRKRGGDFRHGRFVRFYCYSGYQRVGAASVVCNDGKWNNQVPLCKGVCGRPRTSLRVRLHGNSYLDGDKVTISCDGNHDLFGKAELSCVGQTWDSPAPECKARCTLMGPPKNGFYIKGTRNKGDMIKHGEQINYDCIGNYLLVGNSAQRCSDGQWTNPSPTCKAIQRQQTLLVQQFVLCGRDALSAVRNCMTARWDVSCKIRDGSMYYYVTCAHDARRLAWVCKTGVTKRPYCCDYVCPN